MSKNPYKTTKKIGDYIGYCDTCGQFMNASQATVQGEYTGNEGSWVCVNCVDAVDYGLIPFVIEAEQPIPISTSNHYASNPNDVPNDPEPSALDFTLIDPMSISNPKNEL